MAFFDKVKEVGSKGLDMAKDAGETAKYKIQISSTEDDIKKVFIEMGKKLLEEHADVAQELFGELGMDLTTAVTIFLKQSVREGRIPFAIHKYKPQAPVEMHYPTQPSQMMEAFDEVARRLG